MSEAYTFYFSDIFPTYTSWQEFSQQLLGDKYEDNAEFDLFCYNNLARKYGGCNIRYLEPEAFICELSIVYYDKFEAYKKQKEIINNMYNLTADDLVMISEGISNIANNPNYTIPDPKKPVDYMSAQTYSLENNNKLKAYFESLEQIPTLRLIEFLDSFSYLFMNIQPNESYYYKRSE